MDWPTQEKDISAARKIIEEYANQYNTDALGLFELFLNRKEKRFNFRLSHWVLKLAQHFNSIYGSTQGDYVTRKVISHCLTEGQTLH